MKKNRLLRNENESSLSQYTLVPIFRDPLKKKRLLKSVRKRVRARVKRKSAVTFVTALFFLVDRNIELSNLIWNGLAQITDQFKKNHYFQPPPIALYR
jgi:hypothetical protein